jgi:hypothetical protein
VERTEERIRHNNDVFRAANERIRDAVEKYDHDLEEIPFLCECPVEDCVEVIRLTEAQYASIRANPNHYMTAVGHEGAEAPAGEVVSRADGYVVVEK